jgi:hypothetical protein
MRWRQIDSGEIPALTRDKTIARGAITEDASPERVVYTLVFTDGTELRSKHTATPDGIMNQYEIDEP